MTRRKQSRKRHRDQRRSRAPGDAPPAPARLPAAAAPQRISWLGLLGSSLGVLLLGQAAVFNLISSDGTTFAAAALAAIACLYLPAVWASLAETPRRQGVLRAVLAVTLIFIVAGVLFIDSAFATLLLLPSTFLAIASGLVFQGNRRPTP